MNFTKAACLNKAEQQVDSHQDKDVCAASKREGRKITDKSFSVAKLFAVATPLRHHRSEKHIGEDSCYMLLQNQIHYWSLFAIRQIAHLGSV